MHCFISVSPRNYISLWFLFIHFPKNLNNIWMIAAMLSLSPSDKYNFVLFSSFLFHITVCSLLVYISEEPMLQAILPECSELGFFFHLTVSCLPIQPCFRSSYRSNSVHSLIHLQYAKNFVAEASQVRFQVSPNLTEVLFAVLFFSVWT